MCMTLSVVSFSKKTIIALQKGDDSLEIQDWDKINNIKGGKLGEERLVCVCV
jgi:hypothetical protein